VAAVTMAVAEIMAFSEATAVSGSFCYCSSVTETETVMATDAEMDCWAETMEMTVANG